ncbi:MAG: flavodoxin family protein [Firmicutes bacterium]|nr:flavodoxin family protein [Bacillota bacterium]
MKKILILNGAGKKNGNTAALIKAFTEGAESSGNEVREFYLQRMNIKGCLDCQACAKNEPGKAEPCAQRDDMSEIYHEYWDSDVVVFASPVYFWDITGTLKTAVDRIYAALRGDSAKAYPKKTALLLTSGGSKIDEVDTWYVNLLRWTGWSSLGEVLNDNDAARKLGESIK